MSKEQKGGFRTAIGGQAVIEGIMMRGMDKAAVVVRAPEGVVTETWPVDPPRPKSHVLAWPFVRGLPNFVSSMRLGYKALNFSANYYPEEENAKPSKLDQWLEKHKGAVMSVLTVVAMLLGVVLALALFTLLPTWLGGLLQKATGMPTLVRSLCEGVLRVLIFLLYLLLVTRMKDIQRVFAYHGAEHKTIACYEAGQPLTVENVKTFTRFHPRCGTSFLLNVVIIGVLLFFWVTSTNLLVRLGLRLALLPVVVSLAYEFNRWTGRHENWLSRLLRTPGLWLQRLTTREPDDGMIEIGIQSLEMVRPEQQGSDTW